MEARAETRCPQPDMIGRIQFLVNDPVHSRKNRKMTGFSIFLINHNIFFRVMILEAAHFPEYAD
jgi:hypothetical protein